MHQDIAPRNLLVDPSSQKLILFDFNWAACGKIGLLDGRDDLSSVVLAVYEIITNDTQYSKIPHWKRNLDLVQSIPDLPHVPDDEIPFNGGDTRNEKPVLTTGFRMRHEAIANGQYCFRWEKSPQSTVSQEKNSKQELGSNKVVENICQ